MLRKLLFPFICSSLFAISVMACRSAEPTATPTVPTPLPPVRQAAPTLSLPQAAVKPVTTGFLQATAVTTTTIALAPFIIELPTPWLLLQPESQAWFSQVQQVQATKPRLVHYLETLLTVQPKAAMVVAWHTAPSTDLTLIVAVTRAEGLTLQSYLAAAREELEQSRLMVGSGVRVKSADIRYDLHQAQVPVMTLHYTLDMAKSAGKATEATEDSITGYQAVMLDPTGEHLLLLTFITHNPTAEAALPLIDSIVAAIQIEPVGSRK
jgi:hypothetical protein